ncbi:MAG: PQQ-binding-like beta-propeller repeat protein, partial [Pseudomonadota bacterium]
RNKSDRPGGYTHGAGILGGGSPAIRGPLTIVPFQTGALTAVLTNSGRTVWNATVSGGRRGLARARLSDITGDPVIDNDIVYTANQAGRMVSLDRRSGERNWTLQEGASGPALPIGGSVFVVTDAAKLVRIDAETGDPIWSQALPEAQEINNRNVVVPHYGPILAGGRLLVAGGDGMLRSFAPVDGRPLGEVELGGFAAAPPALVGGILFVVCTDGTLRAFQ